MPNTELKRCMGIESNRATCMQCKRLPRNAEDEKAKVWLVPMAPCEWFSMAGEGYLARHKE